MKVQRLRELGTLRRVCPRMRLKHSARLRGLMEEYFAGIVTAAEVWLTIKRLP